MTVRASQAGSSNYNSASNVDRSFLVTIGSAVVTTPEQVPAPPSGGSATLEVTNSNPNVSYQWQRNGANLEGATGASLTLGDVQPPTAGLYTYTATVPGGAGGTSEPVIVGLSTDEKVVGTGEEVGADIVHPNGNTYDQVLLEGNGASITSNPNQITRISFVDLSNDIVQVEFSGVGTLSVVMDGASTPTPAANYNQPGVDYVKGHVGLVITGANETSNLSIISVGPITAVNQSLFKSDVTYDGVANIAFVAIQSSNGKFGSIRTGNVHYFAS
ncbi:MAG TPA: immunoglobulin domain-containing protein, partial [Opitutus sp.]|nr:immunoglobulin domain-containing protein [Opitutus sp.]